MTSFKRIAAVAALLVLPGISQAGFISGDVTNGTFAGSVSINNAWVASNPIDGTQVNFWTLSGQANQNVSILIDSSFIEFGVSLYTGVIDEFDLFFPGFDNAGDIGDNLFVGGTPFFGASGTLLNVVLPETGMYTIAVGGEEGLVEEGAFAYNMSVTQVPEPGTWLLLAAAVLGAGVLRRRVG